MIEIRPEAAPRRGVRRSTDPPGQLKHLDRLLLRTAAGDRQAFRGIYAGLALRVWLIVTAVLPGTAAAPVIDAVFLEVWLRAESFDPARGEARAWITSIAARRALDRLRARHAADDARTDAVATEYDRQVRRDVAILLGPGPAMVRTAPAALTRIEGLDRAVGAIAAAHGVAA